jgi:hypothetical protein
MKASVWRKVRSIQKIIGMLKKISKLSKELLKNSK